MVTAGEALRDEGMDQVEAAADPRLILMIDAKIQEAIDSGRRFSANTIRDQFPVANSNLAGARFRAFTRRKVNDHPVMVRVGYEPSTLASTRAHEIKVWLGWDAYQALNSRTA